MTDEIQNFMRKHPVSKWCESFSPASKVIHGALKERKKVRGVKEKKV